MTGRTSILLSPPAYIEGETVAYSANGSSTHMVVQAVI